MMTKVYKFYCIDGFKYEGNIVSENLKEIHIKDIKSNKDTHVMKNNIISIEEQ